MAEPDTKPIVRVRGLNKVYVRQDKSLVPAIDNVDLDIMPGEFVVLLGPSGCGKTTLLRCIAGLEKPDSGEIEIGGRTVYSSVTDSYVLPEHRKISMIFQSYALWPHMTAFDNVAYPLKARKISKSIIAERVRGALAQVGIAELELQYPGQLSGGQQQRVALARAIVSEDTLVLFDEPLSNVDAKVREQLRVELLDMQHKFGFAAVYVTHDQSEAMSLANRVAVLSKGKIRQLGKPEDIYHSPRSRYVAKFIGTSNELRGEVLEQDEEGYLKIASNLGDVWARSKRSDVKVGDTVTLIFRPEHVRLAKTGQLPGGWSGTVETSAFAGPFTEYRVRIGDYVLVATVSGGKVVPHGRVLDLLVSKEDMWVVEED